MNNAADSSKRAISISYVQVVVDLVEERGGDKNLLLKKAGIEQQPLNDFFTFITVAQYERLLLEAKDLLNDPALGLHIGKQMTFGSHGTFAFAALSFSTMWKAMEVGQKFSQLCNGIVDMQLEEGEEFNTIRIETEDFSGALYQTVIEIVMGIFCEIFNLMFDGNTSPIEIEFSWSKPDYDEQYSDVFKPSFRFNSACNEIRIPVSMANKRLAMADPIIASKFEQECDELIAKMAQPKDMSQKVREALFISKDGFPSLDEVALQFNMSSRTLRRRLQECDTSFKKILEEVRLETAQHYLKTTPCSIGEISHLLGYNDQNSFSHAFKVLSGIPPTEFRKRFGERK